MISLVAAMMMIAQVDPSEPPPPLERTIVAVDAIVRCRALIEDDELEAAERCFREVMRSEDQELARRAGAMADVVGAAEGVVAGTIGGAIGGFTIAGALFSTTRTSEKDSLPWLVAAPAVGAVAGAAGSFAWIEYTDPDPGDVALTWSMMFMGAASGFNLQLAVFDQSPDVGAAPLRFLTIVGGGAIGLGAGALLSVPIDATRGDIAVAHSAALWGGTLATIGIFQLTGFNQTISFPQGVLIGGAGILLPYAAVIAAHAYIDIDYWPSGLIDAGGAAGVLSSFAALAVLSPTGIVSAQTGPAIIGVGTAAGVALGTAAAVTASNMMRGAE